MSTPLAAHVAYAARVAMGVTGEQQVPTYGRAAGDRGRGRVTAIARVSFAEQAGVVASILLALAIAADLPAQTGEVAVVLMAGGLAIGLGALLAVRASGSGTRLKVLVGVVVNAGIVAAVAAQVSSLTLLAVLVVGRGLLLGYGQTLQRAMLVDVVPPEARVRALARYRGAAVLGAAVAAGLAAGVLSGPEWPWRAVLTGIAVVGALLGLALAFVDDPGVGGFEGSRLRKVAGEAAPPVRVDSVGGSLGRAARTAGARVSGTGFAGAGFAGLGSIAATVAALQDKDLTIGSALLGLTAAWAGAALVVVLAADGLEARRRADPSRLASAVPVLLGVAAIGVALTASLPSGAGALAAAGVVAAATGLALACLDATALSSAEPADRAAVAALATCSVIGGAVLAVLWVNFAANRFEGFVALATLSLPVAACAAASLRLPKAATASFDERLDALAFRMEALHGPEGAPADDRTESGIPAWLLAPPPVAAPPPTWPPTLGWQPAPMPPPAAPWTPAPPLAAPDPLSAPFEQVVAAAQAEHLAELAGTPTVFDAAPDQPQPALGADASVPADVDHAGWVAGAAGAAAAAAAAHGASQPAWIPPADIDPLTAPLEQVIGPMSLGAATILPGAPLPPAVPLSQNGHGPSAGAHHDTAPANGHAGPLAVAGLAGAAVAGAAALHDPAAPHTAAHHADPNAVEHHHHAAGLPVPHRPAGDRPRLLEARGVDYSYGSVQVLFDVTMDVGEGELVALLGPNGVGKTTLLRVLSGLAKPNEGRVVLGGQDVTKLGAPKRVALGLSEIVGGQAVFGSMTVAENLRMYGFSIARDKAAVSEGIDKAYEAFPRLAERRNQLASTLSGGEQQMLGLSKALLLKPRILMVDEFSLGLAPVIVGELMGMVRQLNAEGTAVLLVEQSVNVALSLVHRAYFMEKGRIIFEGLASDLRGRPDLVAEITLGGHADALAKVAS